MVVVYCNYSNKQNNKFVACIVVCGNNRRDDSKELGKPFRKCDSRKNRPNESVIDIIIAAVISPFRGCFLLYYLFVCFYDKLTPYSRVLH
jgi:hypothetical protein